MDLDCKIGWAEQTAATLAARPLFGALETPVVAASMFGLAAMGVRSATVRLLMRRTGSTNVMTTTSQIAIDATQLAWVWLRRHDGSAETLRQGEACRQRLRNGLPLPLGFLLGTLLGAIGLAHIGYPVLTAPWPSWARSLCARSDGRGGSVASSHWLSIHA